MRAPEFSDQLEWFNVAAPLTLAELRGKLVLLDFWTYCCINCMHILPDLRYLEQKYPDTLTVIGIHSPKFPNERVGKQLAQAISRYDIRHPVAHDPAFIMWQQYGVHAWPTLVLLDTQGEIVAAMGGEGHRQQLDHLIQQQLLRAKQQGSLQPRILSITCDEDARQNVLAFPGKVIASADRFYISDSGHQQIVETDPEGKLLRRWGRGEAGFADGTALQAAFNNPQGLTIVDQRLLVADTDNHALRAIDLLTGVVTTIAGTGEQGGQVNVQATLPLHTALNSPWDLLCYQQKIYIAMAGSHQLWLLDLSSNRIGVWAGSGREDIQDGLLVHAAFAQPSGITLGKNELFVADSETSAIRRVDLTTQQVTSLVGMGLFEFGDQDGVGRAARLQHPLGVVYDAARHALWIADSYNHKIRKIDLTSLMVTTLPLAVVLAEPGGLSLWQDQLLVADTNNRRILKIDLHSHAVTPLPIIC